MKTTARRYTSPVTPPPLVTRPAARPAQGRAPVLCLRCAGIVGHVSPPLVTFDWGRVAGRGWR